VTILLSRAQITQAIAKASRAPSPHNIQPARWKVSATTVELHEDTSRWLSVGDPTGRDNRISLGMAWEGMSLALSEFGCALDSASFTNGLYPPSAAQRLVAQATLKPRNDAEQLAAALEARRSYRGVFSHGDANTRAVIDGSASAHAHVAAMLPEASSTSIANWYDEATVDGLKNPAFASELYRWMRFSTRNENWQRDGLSADCMALSKVEGLGASFALRPGVVRTLQTLGMLKSMVSEATKVKSAAAIVLIHAPPDQDDFAAGRAWYRFWLQLALDGIVGVPMSALTDSERHAQQVLMAYPIPRGHRLISCMRLGKKAGVNPARSARLPVSELLL
jgi:hypothetical protein